MQRKVPPELVRRMGMGKLFDECRHSLQEALNPSDLELADRIAMGRCGCVLILKNAYECNFDI